MSLLNEVLKNLDARQAASAAQRPLPSAVRPLPAQRDARWPWVLAAVLGGACVAALAVFVVLRPSAYDATPVAAAPPAQPAAGASLEPVGSSASAPANEAPVVVAPAAPVADRPDTTASGREPAVRRVEDTPPAARKDGTRRLDAPTAGSDAPATPAGRARQPAGAAAAPAVDHGLAPVARSADGPDRADRADKASKVEKPEKAAIERSDASVAGERVDTEYRKAINALNQGRVVEAIEGLRGVLRGDPLQRAARQLLVKLLIEAGRNDEAIDVLREGVRGQPAQIGWAMALARLQVERGDLAAAWATLDESLPAAGNSADYQGFAGNVLQRLGRSREAIARFEAAARLAPGDGRWWLGLGLAHDAEGETDAARDALLRARQCANLSPDVLALIERKLHQ